MLANSKTLHNNFYIKKVKVAHTRLPSIGFWSWSRFLAVSLQVTHTHTHTHTFNGPFSGTTQLNRYQKGKTNLDFTEVRDSEWQWHQLGHMKVCTSLQTDNHASTPPLCFYRPDALPAAQPTASKHWRQPAGDLSHKPGGRLPLLSTWPVVTLATLKRAATNFAAWWTQARWLWTVCLRLLPDSVATAIWTQALLHPSPAC